MATRKKKSVRAKKSGSKKTKRKRKGTAPSKKKKKKNGSAEFTGFPKETVSFLKSLKKNNKKTWFDKNKDKYESFYLEPAIAFVDAIGPQLKTISKGIVAQPKVNGSVRRIYRDTRFSKDKTPYKTYLDIMFHESKKGRLGCALFLRIDPTHVALGLGTYGMEGKDLDKFRKAVDKKSSGESLVKIVKKLEKSRFEVSEPHYKRVPKGYDQDHPREQLLRNTSMYVFGETKIPKDMHSKKFVSYCITQWKKMKPLWDWIQKV